MRGHGGGPVHRMAIAKGEPEFALGHVVSSEECQLVGLLEGRHLTFPRPARLAVPLKPFATAQLVELTVEMIAEAIAERLVVVGEESRGHLGASNGHARKHRQIRPHVVAAILLEILIESAGPAWNGAFPTDAVEMGQRCSSQRAGRQRAASCPSARSGRQPRSDREYQRRTRGPAW